MHVGRVNPTTQRPSPWNMGSKPHGLTHEISWVIMGRPTVTHGALWADPLARFQVEYHAAGPAAPPHRASPSAAAASRWGAPPLRRIALWSYASPPLLSTMEARDAPHQDRSLDAPFLLTAAPCAPPRLPRSCHQQTSQPAIEEGDGSYGRMLQLSAPHPPSLSPRRRQRWTSTCVDAAGMQDSLFALNQEIGRNWLDVCIILGIWDRFRISSWRAKIQWKLSQVPKGNVSIIGL